MGYVGKRVRLNGMLVYLSLITLVLSFGAVTAPLCAEEWGLPKKAVLTGSHSNGQFLAGRSVRISAEVEDDVFAAGRIVTFDGAKIESAIAAGYAVIFKRSTARDVIALAGELKVAGDVQDDLVAAARRLRIAKVASIGGDARLAARKIELAGRIGGNVRAVTRQITISGTIDGKADLLAERIVIAPGARIAGDLIYRSGNRPEIAEGASIGGTVQEIKTGFPTMQKIGRTLLAIGLALLLAWALGILVLGAVVQLIVPGLMEATADRLRQRPWAMLGRGVALLLLLPAVAGLLFATVIGIPVGILFLLVLFLLWWLGLVAVAYSIGLWMRGRLGRPTAPSMSARILWTLAGLVVVGVVSLVPFVGIVVALLALAAGIGAVAAQTWGRLQPAQGG